jgi:hypothetical protein
MPYLFVRTTYCGKGYGLPCFAINNFFYIFVKLFESGAVYLISEDGFHGKFG